MTLLDAVAPLQIIRAREDKSRQERAEAVSMRLALRILQSAETDLKAKDYPRFDGNPGDSQCQVRAICLLYLAENEQATLLKEIEALRLQCGLSTEDDKSGAKATGLSALVRSMVCNQKTSLLGQARNEFAQLQISDSLCFLLQAYLSEIVREIATIDRITGRICTYGEADRLDRIEGGLNEDRSGRISILQYNQTELSKLSTEFLKQLMIQYDEQGDLLEREIQTCSKAPIRTFTSLFHSTRAALSILCKMQGVVCIQEIVPKTGKMIDRKRGWKRENERPIREFFFQAPSSLEKIWNPIAPPNRPVMVIQVVMNESSEAILSRLEKESLGSYILNQAANTAPYHNESTLQDVPNQQEREVIRTYQTQEPIPFLDLHHYFIEIPKVGGSDV